MKRVIAPGYELDDDPVRIDRKAVHAYLAGESYWAAGRAREVMDDLIDTAARVVGLYAKLGFERPGERTMERWPSAP